MAREKILVVDDEAVVRKIIEHHLVSEGFQVLTLGDGSRVLEAITTHKPDLIILDILLPAFDGVEICREIRKDSNIPVIFVSAKIDTSDIVLGLGIGGDDYVVKPFNPKELIARVKAHLRRSQLIYNSNEHNEQGQVLRYPGLEINLPSRSVLVDGTPVNLTNKEFEILALLAQNPNRVFAYQQLLELIWHYKYDSDYRTVMVHINRLRKKIEPNPSKPKYVITVKGIGYKFQQQYCH